MKANVPRTRPHLTLLNPALHFQRAARPGSSNPGPPIGASVANDTATQREGSAQQQQQLPRRPVVRQASHVARRTPRTRWANHDAAAVTHSAYPIGFGRERSGAFGESSDAEIAEITYPVEADSKTGASGRPFPSQRAASRWSPTPCRRCSKPLESLQAQQSCNVPCERI